MAATVAGVLGGFLSGRRRNQPELHLKAEDLLLIDKQGNPRGAFAIVQDVPTLSFTDENGKARIALGVRNGEPFFNFYDVAQSQYLHFASRRELKTQGWLYLTKTANNVQESASVQMGLRHCRSTTVSEPRGLSFDAGYR